MFRPELKTVAVEKKPAPKRQSVVDDKDNLPLDCPISSEPLVNPVLTKCGHTFEDSQIKDWIKRNEKIDEKGTVVHAHCPCCFEEGITIKDLRPNLALKAILPYLQKQKEQHEKLLAAERKEKEELQAKLITAELGIKSLNSSNESDKDKKEEKKEDGAVQSKPSKMQSFLETSASTEPAIKHLLTTLSQLKKEKKKLLAARIPGFLENTRMIRMLTRDLKNADKKKMKMPEDFKKDVDQVTKQFFGTDKVKFDSGIKALEQKLDAESTVIDQERKSLGELISQMKASLRAEIIGFYFKDLAPVAKKIEKASNELRLLQKTQQTAFAKAGVRLRLRTGALTNGVFAGVVKKVKIPPVVKASKDDLNLIFVHAVANKDVVEAKRQLASGAQVEALHESGYTAFQIAVHNRDVNMVKLLLEHKADPNVIQPDDNITPLLRIFNTADYKTESPLQQMAHLLIRYMSKAAINLKDFGGDTALHWAAYSDDLDSVLQLIDKGADANATNKKGNTPLKEMQIANEMMAEILQGAMGPARPGLGLR